MEAGGVRGWRGRLEAWARREPIPALTVAFEVGATLAAALVVALQGRRPR